MKRRSLREVIKPSSPEHKKILENFGVFDKKSTGEEIMGGYFWGNLAFHLTQALEKNLKETSEQQESQTQTNSNPNE